MANPAPAVGSLIGLQFSHYRVIEEIGSGGMGVVYRGYDTHLEREVAIKVLHPGTLANDHSRKRFRNEAFALSKLNHPNIATVHDFETHDGRDFLVMELIHGINLAEKLLRGPLSEEELLLLGVQLCDGLAAAHTHGVVHRDLKPGNLRLTVDGRLKILDFGLAKLHQPSPQEGGSATTLFSEAFAGTVPYMAPEQLTGADIDARTDIYAAGLILYEMATGQRPFAELHSSKLIGAILHQAPIPPSMLNPRVSPDMESILGRCLEKAPENRYQSAQELAHELHQFETGVHTAKTVDGTGALAMPSISKNKKWIVLITLLVVLFGTAVALRSIFPTLNSTGLAAPAIPRAKQLVVLPFTVTDGDAKTVAFSAGLTETLTAKLTQLTGDPLLQVVPAPEVWEKRITSVDAARQEFGVNLVLEGNLHKSGRQMRINVSLVDPLTRRQLRATSLTVADGDAFRAEDAVVSGAVEMLGMDTHLKESGELDSYGTQVAGAYDYYLQGRGYLQDYHREENLDTAIQVFQHALALDKNYALAYAGLGEAYWLKYRLNKQPQWLQQSRKACHTANQLDGQLPAAHACLGALFVGTGNYTEATKEFSLVLQNEPTNDAAYNGLADAYEHIGNLQEAETTFKRAIAVRPHYWATYNWLGAFYYRQARFHEASDMFRQVIALAPDNSRGYYNLAGSLLEEARYEDALKAAQRSIEIQPADYGYLNLGNAYFYLKRYEEAVRAFEHAIPYAEKDALLWWNLGDGYYRATGRRSESVAAYQKCATLATQELQVNPKDSYWYGVLAICEAMVGQRDSALEALNRGITLAPNDPFLMFQAALIHNQLNERQEAMRWLAKSRAAGYPQSKIRDCPNFEPLHSDPKFQEILRAP
jgi:tetratricopeptide (TPR) repeat protein/TolB-like protein/tRNA A-37 threonylcarbamoyl transferase component Bud32